MYSMQSIILLVICRCWVGGGGGGHFSRTAKVQVYFKIFIIAKADISSRPRYLRPRAFLLFLQCKSNRGKCNRLQMPYYQLLVLSSITLLFLFLMYVFLLKGEGDSGESFYCRYQFQLLRILQRGVACHCFLVLLQKLMLLFPLLLLLDSRCFSL